MNDYSIARKSSITPESRFPFADSFEIDRATVITARQVIETLTPLMKEERVARIEEVVRNRSHDVLFITEGAGKTCRRRRLRRYRRRCCCLPGGSRTAGAEGNDLSDCLLQACTTWETWRRSAEPPTVRSRPECALGSESWLACLLPGHP